MGFVSTPSMFSVTLWLLTILVPLQIVIGDLHGRCHRAIHLQCAGGRDTLKGGGGRDRLLGGKQHDRVRGGEQGRERPVGEMPDELHGPQHAVLARLVLQPLGLRTTAGHDDPGAAVGERHADGLVSL